MKEAHVTTTHLPRRSPSTVMRLSRLGSLHQSRLSFCRVLLRRMAKDGWRVHASKFEIDEYGVGHAVYTAAGPQRTYSLVAFAHDLPDEQRSDRVIAEAWDATFALFDGIPTPDDIERLSKNVPVQEAGRLQESELCLSRANRSVRLWDHVVGALATGRQPDIEKIRSVGYLMRTTAVYGSGKFGAADREKISGRAEMSVPFQAEMLSVYLIRVFVRDLVEHMARAEGHKDAVPLDPEIARQLGIGNSTGLGMAPFLINHPVLFNNWIMAREEAIARVRSLPLAEENSIALFKALLRRSNKLIADWHSEHPLQLKKLAALRSDLASIEQHLLDYPLTGDAPWERLVQWATETLTEEGQEFLLSLMLEPYPDLVDDLAGCMADQLEREYRIDGQMSVAQAKALLEVSFGWAVDLDWNAPEHCARAWYTSEEKLEPRLGERFEEPIDEYEQPLAPAWDAAMAIKRLGEWDDDQPVAAFLLQNPCCRSAIRRAQMSTHAPYGEIRDNTISAKLMPIDMLRAKLSFFGATHFDPRSDRWVRISLFSGAPYPEKLTSETAEYWVYPEISDDREPVAQ